MDITVKKMETEAEFRGKAYVHWKAWHEAYPGIVSPDYLAKLTLEKCEEMAYRWPDNILVAKDGEKVIGFVGCGNSRDETPGEGEIFAIYVLADYYGTGAAQKLMAAALEKLKDKKHVCLWVLKDNPRAIRFYEKCGFAADGEKLYSQTVKAEEIRMVR